MSGSWRRCAAVPTATPASMRPPRGRTNGGRAVGGSAGAGGPGAGPVVAGLVTVTIVAPSPPVTTPVITLEERAPTNQGRMGAFPDGFGGRGSARSWHDIGTAPRSAPAGPSTGLAAPASAPRGRRPVAQLRRSRTDKILGGVNGGLAEYSGIDPLLWRVGFVALAFAGGTGVLVYLLLWLLMPAGPPGAATSTATGRAVRAPKRPAGPRSPVPGITMAALLIVIGVLAMIDRLTGADLGPRAFIGSALLVVGLGLVAASRAQGRTGRGGLIALGVVLSLALIAAANEPWRHPTTT